MFQLLTVKIIYWPTIDVEVAKHDMYIHISKFDLAPERMLNNAIRCLSNKYNVQYGNTGCEVFKGGIED